MLEYLVSEHPSATVGLIISDMREQAVEILQESILNAVAVNQEFSYEIFLEAILRVTESPGLINIRPAGNGWGTVISVDINLLEYAGSADDWARGVESTRDNLMLVEEIHKRHRNYGENAFIEKDRMRLL